jgi:hypothetical protein
MLDRMPIDPWPVMDVTKKPSVLAKLTRRKLGMHGTLGASDTSAYQDEYVDARTPDSPDELEAILNKNFVSDIKVTLSFVLSKPASPTSPGPAPVVELPPFKLTSSLPKSSFRNLFPVRV